MERRDRRPFGLLLCCLLPLLAPLSHAADEAPAATQVGEFPPPLLGSNRQGQLVDLEQRRGRIVVVTFWASWCGPCMRELPILAQLQKVVGKDALEVIAVNWGEPRADVVAFARRNGKLDLEYVFDGKGETAARYGVRAVPRMLVLDREGRIASIHVGYSVDALPGFMEEIVALLPDEVRSRPASNAPSP